MDKNAGTGAQKPRPAFLQRALFLVLCASLLSGCAAVPIQLSSSYWREIYKRINYRIEGRYRVMDIFYATSRKIGHIEGTPQYFKKPELSAQLSYGTLEMKIDPRVKIGRMLPDQLKKMGIISMQDMEILTPGAFTKQLSDTVKVSPHKSVMLVVFGYKDSFEVTAIKAAYSAYLLDVNTPVVLFDWPGDQPVNISGYKKAQSMAVASGPYLGELILNIVREVKPQKLWINASSLGCQVVCDAFDYIYKHSDISDSEPEVDHVILAAPDVGQDEFNNKFKDELEAISRKLTAYVSSDDDALLVSALINQDKRLGRQKSKITGHEQLAEVKDLIYLKSLSPEKFTVIDVTPINQTSYKHGYYLECPEFFDDLYQRIFDKQPNVNRRLYLLKVHDNVDYWILQGEK